MGIVFVAALTSALANFILFRLIRLAGQSAGPGFLTSVPRFIFSVPLGVLILSGTLAVMLPTRLGKALPIALLFLFFSALLAAILFIVLVLSRWAAGW